MRYALRYVYPFILMLFYQSVEARPEWVDQSNRQVIGGDILHWGTGVDASAQVAVFKAKQMAIKALMEECGGVAHKDIIPWDKHVEQTREGYRAWTRVGLAFDSCDQAKGRNGKRYENPEIVRSQELYTKLLSADMGLLKPEEKEKVLEDVRREAQRQYDRNQHHFENRLEQLEEKINAMKHPTVELPAKLPATSSMKIACIKRLKQMEHVMQMKAPANGNLADPSVVDYYNRYQVEADICNSYK